MIRYVVLGSGTTFPDAERGPAGFVVLTPTTRLLVDGGSGTQQRLMRAGIDPRSLDAGVYSHWHPDHMGDLMPLLFTFRVTGRDRPYPIHASAGFQHVLDGLEALFGHWLHVDGAPVTNHPLGDVQRIGDIEVRSAPANHGAGARHLSFAHGGHRVVFSGDTGPSDALVQLATGADLLVCECASSATAPIEGHLDASQIAEMVAEARPAEVWLTHLYPEVDPDEAVATVAATGIPTRRAADLDVWEPR